MIVGSIVFVMVSLLVVLASDRFPSPLFRSRSRTVPGFYLSLSKILPQGPLVGPRDARCYTLSTDSQQAAIRPNEEPAVRHRGRREHGIPKVGLAEHLPVTRLCFEGHRFAIFGNRQNDPT